jgi:hypothetical protein
LRNFAPDLALQPLNLAKFREDATIEMDMQRKGKVELPDFFF